MNLSTGNSKSLKPGSRDLSAVARLRECMAYLAVLAMVLAGPVHLWLGHGDHDCASSEIHTVVDNHVACQHDHCGPHLAEQTSNPAESQDSSPCDHSENCDTCMALASFAPLHVSFVAGVTQLDFLEYVITDRESLATAESGLSNDARGPPSRI